MHFKTLLIYKVTSTKETIHINTSIIIMIIMITTTTIITIMIIKYNNNKNVILKRQLTIHFAYESIGRV